MSISIENFVKSSKTMGEASALMADNRSDVTIYSQILENLGYHCVVDSADASKYLSEGEKVYGIVNEKNFEFYYSLAKDYACGDIHLFDFKNKKKIWITPNRETSSFILIITKSDIEKFLSKGFDFSTVCESAYSK